ncbi:SRPBCC family protein [Microbacterium sp. RU33B]|uniref:SRPBCC family protein n=1 Tax=Microbacterium sp. RU33B TaxID=1907390 RepID=UPI00095EFFCE|nr:SRPBCC family protein [Microbacterium sp. RU33B]SIT78873.1 Activator of Hsp90 ATPase homolog 1-like protein [Microbacterium sp. RU33B]
MTSGERTTEPVPTGTVAAGPLGREIQLTRKFTAPIDAVWASMTESERLERWIGRWEGDHRTGRVSFFMTAEGEHTPAEEYHIEVCEPPHRFAATTAVGDNRWQLRFELSEHAGITTLLFAQAMVDDVGDVGPGWEYYLDRLGAALAGGDVAGVQWDAYYPSMKAYYAALAS